MLYNLLTAVNDNYQSGSIDSAFEAQIFSTAQKWIIGIIVFAIVVTILSTIITYCLYGISNKNNKAVKALIVIVEIMIIIVFIILGASACNAIK